jgi:hypothetical protein
MYINNLVSKFIVYCFRGGGGGGGGGGEVDG